MAVPVPLHGNYYGTREAAEALRRTEGRIRQMVRAKHIEAVAVSKHVWLIPEREIKRILKERSDDAA